MREVPGVGPDPQSRRLNGEEKLLAEKNPARRGSAGEANQEVGIPVNMGCLGDILAADAPENIRRITYGRIGAVTFGGAESRRDRRQVRQCERRAAHRQCDRRDAVIQLLLKLITSGDVDGTMLEALEDYVKRQKRWPGIESTNKEAAN
jgi:hypothetical protein